MKWLIVLAALGCGPSKSPAAARPVSVSPGAPTGTACDGARAKVEQLYRAEAQAREPKRVDEAVTDNTTMVMNDCVQAPDRVAACLASVDTVAELESRCLVALDDEGREGDALAR
jgi:hypothetical protein